MKKVDLESLKKIHFIGIGGIGISAVARMMLLQGKVVSGSDSSESEITEELKKAGAIIHQGHSGENVSSDTDLVVYTIAVTAENPELLKAGELKIPTVTYPQMLGLISEGMFTIAVSGTHGKTTTTAMIAKIMMDAKLDPTVIVGSLLRDKVAERSNFISGKSKYFVVEACEYRRSFLNIKPNILVITNIDNDHLDYYKDMDDIRSAFRELAMKLGPKDFLVCNPHDPIVSQILPGLKCKVLDYQDFFLKKINLKSPGEHNQKDARASLAVSEVLNISQKNALVSLENFPGTWRRFEYKGKTERGADIYDDYGHHPSEIKATVSGARELFPERKIIAVFQPHLYSRTKILFRDFGQAFREADLVLVLPIYAAREKNDPSITAEMLSAEIKRNGVPSEYMGSFAELEKYIKEKDRAEDVILFLGAGDIYKVAENLAER